MACLLGLLVQVFHKEIAYGRYCTWSNLGEFDKLPTVTSSFTCGHISWKWKCFGCLWDFERVRDISITLVSNQRIDNRICDLFKLLKKTRLRHRSLTKWKDMSGATRGHKERRREKNKPTALVASPALTVFPYSSASTILSNGIPSAAKDAGVKWKSGLSHLFFSTGNSNRIAISPKLY